MRCNDAEVVKAALLFQFLSVFVQNETPSDTERKTDFCVHGILWYRCAAVATCAIANRGRMSCVIRYAGASFCKTLKAGGVIMSCPSTSARLSPKGAKDPSFFRLVIVGNCHGAPDLSVVGCTVRSWVCENAAE